MIFKPGKTFIELFMYSFMHSFVFVCYMNIKGIRECSILHKESIMFHFASIMQKLLSNVYEYSETSSQSYNQTNNQ